MTEEDEEFNRIEREAAMRMGAVVSAISKEQKEYERGFIDGMQEQMRRSVDKAVNAMAKRDWVGLVDEERNTIGRHHTYVDNIIRATEAKLREKNT